MPITELDIKLMASQRLSDTSDGGGRKTGVEIVDGNINNLFTDISRLDRTYGRVSLRKVFPSVQTDDTSMYSGCHVVLTNPATDPLVNVCLFSTNDPQDTRDAARDRIESYVTQGPRYQGWLWGNQLQGQRSLLIFQPTGTAAPGVGDVLFLIKDEGTAAEKSQYVRITQVESSEQDFTIDSGGTTVSTTRQIVSLEIGDPLRETYYGIEITNNDSAPNTGLYTTNVADAAKYYGVMNPAQAITAGDISVNVENIFTHLVPSAQGESPALDLSIGEAGPVRESGAPHSVTYSGFAAVVDAQLHFGRGIKPGSLDLSFSGGQSFTDPGNGLLMLNGLQVGTIDYSTGTITLKANYGTVTVYMTATIGTAISRISNTSYTGVELNNRGYNYVKILEPLPSPRTLVVDYMSQGKWYRLRDKGNGELIPDLAGTGTGTINYATGHVSLTVAALPDVGSGILYAWGNPLEVEEAVGQVTIDLPQIVHTVAEPPLMPGSVVISWPSGEGTATATDNGAGFLSGDVEEGSVVDYAEGEIIFRPTAIPAAGSEYTISYDKYPFIEAQVSGSESGGIVTIQLPDAPIKPGTVSLQAIVTAFGHSQLYKFRDNGSSGISAGGFSVDVSLTHPEYDGAASISGLSGSIDYTTGAISIALGDISGSDHYRVPIYGDFIIGSGNWDKPIIGYDEITAALTFNDVSFGSAFCRYSLSAAAQVAAQELLASAAFSVDLTPDLPGRTIVPASICFSWGADRYIDRGGKIYKNPAASNGLGVEIGTINYETGIVILDYYDSGSNSLHLHSMLLRAGNQFLTGGLFRTPGAPLRPGSFSVQGTSAEGTIIAATAAFDGQISGDEVRGYIDVETGIVSLEFGQLVDPAGHENEPWYDEATLEGGLMWKPTRIFAETLNYACVIYSYIPLDADLIGIDPVRLPTDGRVPIVKSGDVVVIHNTDTDQLPDPLSAGQVLTLSRVADVVRLYDATGLYVPTTLYDFDQDTQELTMADPLDLTGFTQPLIANHRIEDMALVSDAQINGTLTLARGVSHDYPVAGTYVSSALLFGDLQARLYGMFDQKTWTSVWSDDQIGDASTANYNDIDFPPVITNKGAVKERWAIVFDSTEHFNLVGEKYGVVADGYITQDFQPINQATNEPFMFIDYRGWGSGWSSGNVLRFNTEPADGDMWVARTTLAGPVTEPNDEFTIQIRGDSE